MDLIYSRPESEQTLEAQLRAYSGLSEEEAQRVASTTFHGGPYTPPPLTPRSDWPHMDEKELRLAEYRIKRIERAINESYPLLEGETIQPGGVFSSYLSADYLDYPLGTAAVRRHTSFGELVFIEAQFVIKGTAITETSLPVVLEPSAEALEFTWGGLAVDIGKGLLGSVVGAIGSAIFEKIFPPGVPPYFDQVYKEFEKIVQGVINETKRKELSGQVASVQDGMITYNTIKRDPSKYQESQGILATIWNDSRYVTNELQQFPEIGLGLFAVSGGLHLAIVQEKALTDRAHKDPNDSQWAAELIRKAQEFQPFAVGNHNRIIGTRANAISEVEFVKHFTNIPMAGPVDDSYWVWKDTFAGDRHTNPAKGSCCDSNPKQSARNDRQARWDSTVGARTHSLAPVIPTADSWRKLGANPIPRPS